MLGHAVEAADVTAVRDADAEVGVQAPKGIHQRSAWRRLQHDTPTELYQLTHEKALTALSSDNQQPKNTRNLLESQHALNRHEGPLHDISG